MAPGLYRSRGDRGPEEPRANGPFQGVGRQGMEMLDARTENPTGKAARPERRPESRACPPPAAKVKKVKACGVPYRSVLYCSYYSAAPMLFWRLLWAFCCSRLRWWSSLLETVVFHYAASVTTDTRHKTEQMVLILEQNVKKAAFQNGGSSEC